jgi:hypothetical protein
VTVEYAGVEIVCYIRQIRIHGLPLGFTIRLCLRQAIRGLIIVEITFLAVTDNRRISSKRGTITMNRILE